MNRSDMMLATLALGFALLLVSFWRAHRSREFQFSAFDLVMENGRVSKIALAFMVAFSVSTWVIIDMELKGKLTPEIFGMYLAAWVAPLVTKVVFQKNEMPSLGAMSETKDAKS